MADDVMDVSRSPSNGLLMSVDLLSLTFQFWLLLCVLWNSVILFDCKKQIKILKMIDDDEDGKINFGRFLL